jgi:hypothetical protein
MVYQVSAVGSCRRETVMFIQVEAGMAVATYQINHCKDFKGKYVPAAYRVGHRHGVGHGVLQTEVTQSRQHEGS